MMKIEEHLCICFLSIILNSIEERKFAKVKRHPQLCVQLSLNYPDIYLTKIVQTSKIVTVYSTH